MKKEKPINLKTPPGSFLLSPIAALDYLFEKRINITDLAVLIILCKYRNNETSMCRPSQSTIGERINRSRTTVSRSIKKLVRCGLLEIVAKANSGEYRTTVYRVIFPQSSFGTNSKERTITKTKFDLEYLLEESRKKGDELFEEQGV